MMKMTTRRVEHTLCNAACTYAHNGRKNPCENDNDPSFNDHGNQGSDNGQSGHDSSNTFQ